MMNKYRNRKPSCPCRLLLLLLCGGASLPLCAGELENGLKSFKQEQFVEAYQSFSKAATNESPHGAIATYNAGTTALLIGEFDESIEHLQEALLKSDDLELTRNTSHNLGNSFFQRANIAESTNGMEQAVTFMDGALESYRNAILLDPAERESKAMYELAMQNRKRLQSIIEQQSQEDQKQSDDQDEGDKDEEDKKEEDSKEQGDDKKEEEKQDDSEKQDEEKGDPSDKSEEEEDKDSESKASDEDEGGDSEEKDKQAGDKSDENEGEESDSDSSSQAEPGQEQPMSKEQVERMLQALRSEEQAARDSPILKVGRPVAVEKNW